MAWTWLKENSCCCCWMWFLIGHFVFQATVRLAARVCLCYLGSSCFGTCVFIILMWGWRACQSEACPPTPSTVPRSPLCILWNRLGTTCFASLGRHLAAIENKQTNTPQSYISCNRLQDSKQNLADRKRMFVSVQNKTQKITLRHTHVCHAELCFHDEMWRVERLKLSKRRVDSWRSFCLPLEPAELRREGWGGHSTALSN